MIVFLLAAALPALFWDQGPDTAELLRKSKILRVMVAPKSAPEWKALAGISAEPFDAGTAVKIPAPAVKMRVNEASATRSPWIDTNGWRFLRKPGARFLYEAPGKAAAIAAAEAFAYGAGAAIHTDAAGLEPLGQMLSFLGGVTQEKLPALANIGYIDDGSDESGEVMNLMTRRNLLFRLVLKPDPALDLNVAFGSKKYSKEEAADPSVVAHKIRSELSDEKRLLRIYGSEIVIGRLEGDASHARLHLINYAAANRPVNGLRIRVRGQYAKGKIAAFDTPDAALQEFSAEGGATEFTLPVLKAYAVIDLSR